MDDDPSCVAVNVLKFNLTFNKHGRYFIILTVFFCLFKGRYTGM